MNQWQVSVAAEALVASLFARCRYDVSLQYGANQPEYDLIVAKNDKIMKVSVKGSQDGSWGLTQSHISNADYHGAAEKWLAKHGPTTVMAFVQFKGAKMDEQPRVYLATPKEVATRLKESAAGRGETILYESHTWSSRAFAAGTTDEIPKTWRFSQPSIEEIFSVLG